MKKMNKSYILTALGVVGSSLLNAPASADLFKCVACTNKPSYAYYTTGSANIKFDDDCHWECNPGFTKSTVTNTCQCSGEIKFGGCAFDFICSHSSSSSSSGGCPAGGSSGSTTTTPSFTCPSGQFKPTSKNICCANNLSGTLTKYVANNLTSTPSNIGGTAPIYCGGNISVNNISSAVTHCKYKWTYNGKSYEKLNILSNTTFYVCNDKLIDSNGNSI